MKSIRFVKRYATTIIIALCILMINIGVFVNYYDNTYIGLKEQAMNYINEHIDEAAQCVDIKIDERFNTIQAIAMYVGNYGNEEYSNVNDILEAHMNIDGFDDYDIVNMHGIGLKQKGSIDYSKYDFFKKVLGGRSQLVILDSVHGQEDAVGFVVPLYKDEEIKGVFISKCSFEEFSTFTDIGTFGNNGNLLIVKQNGELLSKGNGLDEVDNIKQILSADEAAANELISAMKQKTHGSVVFGEENLKRYLCFSKLSYNKWYVVAIVAADNIDTHIESIQDEGVILLIEIGVMFILILLYFSYLIASQIKNSRINKERYFIATENIETVVFDYSIKKDTMYCNEKWKEIFGYELPKSEMKAMMTEHIFEEDVEKFKEEIAQLNYQNNYIKFSVRIMDNEKTPIACLIRIYAIKGFGKNITKIVGVIETV